MGLLQRSERMHGDACLARVEVSLTCQCQCGSVLMRRACKELEAQTQSQRWLPLRSVATRWSRTLMPTASIASLGKGETRESA